MELYIVYEFIYHKFDEDIQESIEFFGLYDEKEEAIKIANRRVKKGIKEYDVVLSENDKINIQSPFSNTDMVDLYRENDDMVSPIYSVCIKKLKLKGSKENEQSNINGKIN